MNSLKGTCCAHCVSKHRQDDERGLKRSFCPCHQPVEEKEEYPLDQQWADQEEEANCKILISTPTPDWRVEYVSLVNGKLYRKLSVNDIQTLELFIAGVLARTQHQTTQKIIEVIEGELDKWFYRFATKESDDSHTLVLPENYGWDEAKSNFLAVLRAKLPQEK